MSKSSPRANSKRKRTRARTKKPIRTRAPSRVEPLCFTIAECIEMGLGSRALIYLKIKRGQLQVFKDGSRTLITAASVHAHHADLVKNHAGLAAPAFKAAAIEAA